MSLIDRQAQVIDDTWIYPAQAGDFKPQAHAILPLDTLAALSREPLMVRPLGMYAPAGTTADLIAPHLHRLDLVVLEFPKFRDGRGFTVARTLRDTHGFEGDIRAIHDLQANQIIATNGGDELLRLAITTFVDPGRAIGIVTPSYGVYSVLAEIHQAPLSRAPLMDDWTLATNTSARWNDAGAQLAILTNPHAPTGALFSLDAIERLAASFSGVLLIDEAYIDFVDPSRRYNAAELIARHSNILLLRTLSKGYSLAGIRMAYGMANAALIEPMLSKTKDSYNVDAIAQRLGTAAIEDRAYARSTWDRVREERTRLTEGLEALGFAVARSQANFVLASVPSAAGSSNARAMKDGLEARGIYVRWFDEDRLQDRLRISIGTGAENTAVLRLLGEMVHERGADRSN